MVTGNSDGLISAILVIVVVLISLVSMLSETGLINEMSHICVEVHWVLFFAEKEQAESVWMNHGWNNTNLNQITGPHWAVTCLHAHKKPGYSEKHWSNLVNEGIHTADLYSKWSLSSDIILYYIYRYKEDRVVIRAHSVSSPHKCVWVNNQSI